MGLFSKKEAPAEVVAPTPVNPAVNDTGMVYVDANGNSVSGSSYIDSNGNPAVNLSAVSTDINQVLPAENNAPTLEAPVINIPNDPIDVVTNTAATVEEPNPIVEQQIAYDIDPNDVFEGRPIEDQITDIVSSTLNTPIAADQPVANPIPVDIVTSEPIVASVNEPVASMDAITPSVDINPTLGIEMITPEINPTSGIEIINPDVNPTPGIEIINPEINPSDGIEAVSSDVVSDVPLPLVSETVIAPPVIENSVGVSEVASVVEPVVSSDVPVPEIVAAPVDVITPEVTQEVVVPNIVNEPVVETPTIDAQPVTDITADIQPITPEIINPVVDVTPQETAQSEMVSDVVLPVEPVVQNVEVQPILESVETVTTLEQPVIENIQPVVQDVQPVEVQPIVEQPVVEQPVIETQPVVETVIQEVHPVVEQVAEQPVVNPEPVVSEISVQNVEVTDVPLEPVVVQNEVEVTPSPEVVSDNNDIQDADINAQIDNLLGITSPNIEPVDPTVLGGTPDVQAVEAPPVVEPIAQPVVEEAVVNPEPVVEETVVQQPVVEEVSVTPVVEDVVNEPVLEPVLETSNEAVVEPVVEVINPVEVANLESIASAEEEKISNEVDNILEPTEPIKLEEYDGPVIPEEKEDNIFSEVNNDTSLVEEVKDVPVEAVIPSNNDSFGPVIVEDEETIFTGSDDSTSNALPPVTPAEETPVVEAVTEVPVSEPVSATLVENVVEEVETLGEELLMEDVPLTENNANNQVVYESVEVPVQASTPTEVNNNLTEIDLLMANSRTETTRFCDSCGTMLGINDQTVCPNCGEPIK